MAERVELVIRTAGEAEFGYRAILCRLNHQIALRFRDKEVIVFTGEGFSPEEYERHCGEIERLQTPQALHQPIRNLSEELMAYALKAAFFDPASLEKISLLDESEKVIVLADAIMGREDNGDEILRPIPPEVVTHIRNQGVLWEKFE